MTSCMPEVCSLKRKELVNILSSAICGAQRVPTILVNNSLQSLSQLNLGSYTVQDIEPLHDLKRVSHQFAYRDSAVFSGECERIVFEILEYLLVSKKQDGYLGSD